MSTLQIPLNSLNNNPFANMSGGGLVNHLASTSASEGGDSSLDGSDMINISSDQFKEAVPSMFEESKSPSMFEKPPVGPAGEINSEGMNCALHKSPIYDEYHTESAKVLTLL